MAVSPRVEARVLEQADALVGQELAQPLLDRLQGERGVGPLGAAEMRHEHDLAGAAVEQEPDRRQRGPDARVVGDAPVLERDVEVDADERALAGDVGALDRARHTRPPRVASRSRPTGSTRRSQGWCLGEGEGLRRP